ncbi:hypothetical protein ACS0TY_005912 [Phlomoides rotata]
MTVKGGTTPACAACKFQRRKCSPYCPLAPYFPASQPKSFENVHRLFGVSYVTKTILKLKTKAERDDAMRSIQFEADIRNYLRVHGCMGVLLIQFNKLKFLTQELERVRKQIKALKDLYGSGQFLTGSGFKFGSNDASSSNGPLPIQEILHQAQHVSSSNDVTIAFNQLVLSQEVKPQIQEMNQAQHVSSSNYAFNQLEQSQEVKAQLGFGSSNDVAAAAALFMPEIQNVDELMSDENVAYLSSLNPFTDEIDNLFDRIITSENMQMGGSGELR